MKYEVYICRGMVTDWELWSTFENRFKAEVACRCLHSQMYLTEIKEVPA